MISNLLTSPSDHQIHFQTCPFPPFESHQNTFQCYLPALPHNSAPNFHKEDNDNDSLLDLTEASEYLPTLNKTSKKITKATKRPTAPKEKKKITWSSSEDKLIWLLYKTVGPQWGKICECLEGKTEMQVKNRFNKYLKKNAGQQEESHRQLMSALIERQQSYSSHE